MSQCSKKLLDNVKVNPFYKWNTQSTYINKTSLLGRWIYANAST